MGIDYEPRGPQAEGIKHLTQKSFCALFWDPGRGKTITTLMAFQILKDAGLARRLLITASRNICEDVWPEEIDKFNDLDLSYSVMTGSESRRMDAWDMDADVYMINYENLHWFNEHFGKRLEEEGFDMFVVDESSKFRNGKVRSRRRKTASGKRVQRKSAFKAVLKMIPKFKRRVILTGTPIPKGYLNLWPQMYIVDMGRSLGQTMTGYRNEYFSPCGYKGKDWTIRDGSEERIEEAIADRVHRAERDNSTPIEFFDLTIKLPGDARDAYWELEQEFITEWQGKTLIAANAAVATSKLRQAANGAIYYDRQKNWTEIHDRKAEAVYELIRELQGSPLLIAYEFGHDYEMLMEHLPRGIKIPQYKGSRADKKKLKNQWDNGDLIALAGQIDSMSHGLNFQYGGYNCLYYGLTFNLDAYEQFYQRVWRDGQEYQVNAYHLVAYDTVDDVMMKVLEDRSWTQKSLLKRLKERYPIR
jgi:hypothetical protein